jgi:glutathione S-transferase
LEWHFAFPKANAGEDNMKLYEISWSIYPRRIGIYLAEKGITNLERVEVDLPTRPNSRIFEGRTLAGTVPAMDTGEGPMIGASIAILEYLEEQFPTPNMLGKTPFARARTREFVSVIEEATIHMGVWVHNASPIFAAGEPQNMVVARASMEAYFGKLRLLDRMATAQGGEFLVGDNVTIADCIAFATLQKGAEFFAAPFPDDCPTLERWYKRFSSRPSGAIPSYPPVLLEMAKGTLKS